MSDAPKPLGTVGWADLTVPNADALRDFYAEVAGWSFTGMEMGGYQDYVMQNAEGTPVAGVCHARGMNAPLPPQWIVYVTVRDLDGKIAACRARGGEVIVGPHAMGDQGRYAVLKDPVGAAFALFESPGA